jgi:FMN phosphatase YigB (HAD superfamily)
MHLRELVQQLHHPVVVFQGMEARPGQAILPRHQVFVERLVLVPQDDYSQLGHDFRFRLIHRQFFSLIDLALFPARNRPPVSFRMGSSTTQTVNSKLKVIFFDVGNTLLFPNRERIHAPLAERGIVPDGEHLRDLECRTKNRFDGIMTGTITKNGSPDHGFWWMFYSQLLSEIGLKDTDEADAIRDQLVAAIQNSGNWDTIRPGTAEQLHEIGARYRIAVISNADGRIEDVLQKCGIAHCFRTITDSGLVGYEKPHREIFRQALKSMMPRPKRASMSATSIPWTISAPPAQACKPC